jgi:hypothetical protein
MTNMNRRLYILIIMFVGSVFALYCCGDGGGTGADLPAGEDGEVLLAIPKVVSLTDASGNSIDLMGSTGVFPTSFTLTFDRAVDVCDGCISLNCPDLPEGVGQPDFTVQSSDEEGKEYTVTVEDAYKYQLKTCALTISEDVAAAANAQASAGKALTLGQDVSFTFTNACAVSDDFNAVSQGCWTPDSTPDPEDPTEGPTWASWGEYYAFGVLSFEEGALVYDDTLYEGELFDAVDALDEDRHFGIYKGVVLEGNLEITIHIKEASGLTAITKERPHDEPNIQDMAMVMVGAGILGPAYAIGLGTWTEDRNVPADLKKRQYCLALSMPENWGEAVEYGIPCETGEHYIRMTYVPGQSVTFWHSTDGLFWDDKIFELNQLFPDLTEPENEGGKDQLVFDDLSGNGFIALYFNATNVYTPFDPTERPPGYEWEYQNNRAVIDSIVVGEGITRPDQY